MFLNLINKEKPKLGQITVGKEFVILSVKKEYLPYKYKGILAIDINKKSVDGIVFKDNKLKPIKWDLSRVYESNQKYFGYRRKLQKNYPNRFILWKKLPINKNYKNRTRWYLDNVSKQLTKFAEKEKLLIVMEDLKNIKKGVNKRQLKLNSYNGKKQMMRTKFLSLLGRLNRTNFRKIQFMIDYKSKWNNTPIIYVDPKNTLKTCSKCGCINGNLKEKRVLECVRCGLKIDRDLNSSINILKLGMVSCGSGRDCREVKIEKLDFGSQLSKQLS